MARADELTGRVVAVSDGDTLTVRVEGQQPVKVRLAGIDAPEHDQPFGQRSRQSLSELAFGHTATVAAQKTDDYGRTVGTVTVGGVNVEAEQVQRGLAWVYRKYSDDARLRALEAEAKAARVVGGCAADAAVGVATRRESGSPVRTGAGSNRIGGAVRGETHRRRILRRRWPSSSTN